MGPSPLRPGVQKRKKEKKASNVGLGSPTWFSRTRTLPGRRLLGKGKEEREAGFLARSSLCVFVLEREGRGGGTR